MSDQPLGEKLIKKGFWLYFFMILIAPAWYFIRVIISNKLEVGDVGLFYSIMWFIVLLSLYNDLWLTEALQYFLPKYRIQKKYNNYKSLFYITLVTQLISWIIIAGLIYLWADWLAIHHFHSAEAWNIIKILCFYFIGINFLQVFNSFYLWFQDTISSNLTDFFRIYGTLAFTVFFRLTNTLTSTSFSIAWITWLSLSLVISTIIFLKKYLHTIKKWVFTRDKKSIKIELKYACRIFLWANVSILFNNLDQQLVINFLGPVASWYYANFFSLIYMYQVILSPILAIIFPIVIELIAKNEIQKFWLLQNLLYKYFSVFALSIGWIFFALWPQLTTIFFGSKFAYSGHLILYIAPFLVINALLGINFWILAWLGMARQRVKIIWRALLVNIVSIILLIFALKIWVVWAVISMALWWIVLWILSLRQINKNKVVIFDWKYFVINAGVIATITAIIMLFKNKFFILDNTHRFSNIYYLVIVILIYYWIIALFNYRSIKNLIKEIKALRG